MKPDLLVLPELGNMGAYIKEKKAKIYNKTQSLSPLLVGRKMLEETAHRRPMSQYQLPFPKDVNKLAELIYLLYTFL